MSNAAVRPTQASTARKLDSKASNRSSNALTQAVASQGGGTSSHPGARAAGGETSAWVVSLAVHFLFLLVISFITTQVANDPPALVVTSYVPEEVVLEELQPEEFHFDPTPRDAIGSQAMGGLQNQSAGQIELPDVPQIPSLDVELQVTGQVLASEFTDATTGPEANLNHSVKGMAGAGVTGADGAIERLTHEIMASLEERPTLVVWFFDRSGSLQTQRAEVLERFHRIYEELGIIQDSQSDPYDSHGEPRLLTSVVGFGESVDFLIDDPTDNLDLVKEAVANIQRDDSGVERVFTAVQMANRRFRKFRTKQDRNVMYILLTDEAGDDVEQLDQTVTICRRLAIPVYVVGVPAPFGRAATRVKWVDPDPKYDQSTQWAEVSQGPESLFPERLQLFGDESESRPAIDSGFGPFALTRLCYETGGIYFTVHPNRKLGRRVTASETNRYTAYFSYFFDPDLMRRYRPEYISAQEYRRRVEGSRMRQSLLRAASQNLSEFGEPRSKFLVRNEAAFANDLTEAQKDAARVAPALDMLIMILKEGEADRQRETVARWQAGYDLAYGRVLANRVRAVGYNAMLAAAKRGLKFSKEENNTWTLKPTDQITGNSRIEREAALAREFLSRVVQRHAGTPWAHLASRELARPLGWKWVESHTPQPKPNQMASNNNNNNNRPLPQDDKKREIKRPEKRPPPRL